QEAYYNKAAKEWYKIKSKQSKIQMSISITQKKKNIILNLVEAF
ncbi:8607_t:CDS:1, partial [Racocetra persica]